MCGVLRWVEQCSRPDISAVLSELCKVQINPGEKHRKAMEHLMMYINSTKNVGIMYGQSADVSVTDGPLVGYVDSDWAGDGESFYTRGGWIFQSWQGTVSWSSYMIKSIAASSCEAEYMSAAQAVRESKWLRYLFSDLGYGDLMPTHFSKLCGDDYRKERLLETGTLSEVPMRVPVMLCCDNQAAIRLSKNPVLHRRSKHIHINFHIVRGLDLTSGDPTPGQTQFSRLAQSDARGGPGGRSPPGTPGSCTTRHTKTSISIRTFVFSHCF